MEDADWTVNDFCVGQKRRHAIGIERKVGNELRARFIPSLVKPFQARIESSLRATRKSHECDPRGIDAWVLGENFKRAVGIQDQIEPPEQRLIGGHGRQTAAGKASRTKVEMSISLNSLDQISMLGPMPPEP